MDYSHVNLPFSISLSQLAYKSGRQQQRGLAFGLQVEQTAPRHYLNTPIPYDCIHNACSHHHYINMPVTGICTQKPYPSPSEPLDLSLKPKAHQAPDNSTKMVTMQSGLRTDRDWSATVKESIQPVSTIHSYPISSAYALKNEQTTDNSFSIAGGGSFSLLTSSEEPSHALCQQNMVNKQYPSDTFLSAQADGIIFSTLSLPVARIESFQVKGEKQDQLHNNSDTQTTGSGSTELLDISQNESCQKAERKKAYKKIKPYKSHHQKKAYSKDYSQQRDRKQARSSGKEASAIVRKSNKIMLNQADKSLTPALQS